MRTLIYKTMQYLQPGSKLNLLHCMINLYKAISTILFTMQVNQVENQVCNRKSLQTITMNVSRLFSLED